MDDDDRLPRLSHDLIDWLDENIGSPAFPTTAEAFAQLDDMAVRRAAFTAGARSLVEQLKDWREETMNASAAPADPDDEEGKADRSWLLFPSIFGSDGGVREILPPASLAVDDT